MGDFNVVRCKEDRRGSTFNLKEAIEFNKLITEAQLREILLAERRFSWMHKSGSSMSKLDKVFCSRCFQDIWPDLFAISKGRVVSDHFPIVLQNKVLDFGSKPFKVFNSWLKQDNIKHVIYVAWSTNVFGKPDYKLKQKLKQLKQDLRRSYSNSAIGLEAKVSSLRKEKEKWDSFVECKELSDSEMQARDDCLHNFLPAEKANSSMLQ